MGGTSLGDNLATAFTTCAPASMGIEEKLQLSRQDKVCYSYEDIMKWVQTRYADNICVLKSIGWLNDNMDANEDLIKSDVISLDPVVTPHCLRDTENASPRSWMTWRSMSASPMERTLRRSRPLCWRRPKTSHPTSASSASSRRAA